jgi:monoamine oxidase
MGRVFFSATEYVAEHGHLEGAVIGVMQAAKRVEKLMKK